MRALTGSIAVAIALAAPAVAAAPRLTIKTPLSAAPAAVRASAGDGIVAWTTADTTAFDSPATLWVRRGGVVRSVGRLDRAPTSLDVGTGADGVPLAAMTMPVSGAGVRSATVILRLDDGTSRPGPAAPAGHETGGAAIDHGRLLFTALRVEPYGGTRSVLRQSTVTATATGPSREVRASRRGDAWIDVMADRGRVAVAVSLASAGEHRDGVAFGPLSGRWRRVDALFGEAGDHNVQQAAGFSRTALVTVQRRSGGPLVRAISLATGRVVRHARLPKGTRQDASVAYLPDTGVLLALGRDGTGARVVGLTGGAFG